MAKPVPQIDFDGARQMALKLHDTINRLFAEFGAAGWMSELVAEALAGLAFIPAIIALPVLQFVIALGAWFAASILEAIDIARQSQKDDINTVIAAAANELLGTDLTGSQLSGGTGGSSFDQNKQLGDALIGVFENGLGTSGGPIAPATGATNARKFAGFAINFGMNQGFLSILTEASSLGFLKEFHELPEGLKGALGLGRLQRAALAPLVRNAISQPYDLYLRALLRPDRLAEGQIVRALKAGNITQDQATQMLAEKGYRDQDIPLLIADLEQKLAAGELFTLVRNGDLTLDQAVQKLSDAGMDADNVRLIFKALDEAKADTQVGGILSDLESAYTDGFIDQPTFNSILAKLPLSDSEEQMYRLKVGSHQERPRKRISFSQLQKGVVNAIVDFTYMDTWLAAEGYSPEDQQVLSFEIFEALKAAADKERFKEYKADVLRKAGKPVPPWLQ